MVSVNSVLIFIIYFSLFYYCTLLFTYIFPVLFTYIFFSFQILTLTFWSNIYFQPFFSSIKHISIMMSLPFFYNSFYVFFECACILEYWLVCLIEFMIFIRLWVTTKQNNMTFKKHFTFTIFVYVLTKFTDTDLKSDVFM